MIIITCPSCGRPLDHTHVKGRSLKCPSCGSQYLYQNGIVIDPIKRYFPPVKEWKDIISEIFSSVIANNDYVLTSKIHVVERKEYYEPFVEVIDKNELCLVDVGTNRCKSVQLITNVNDFKQQESKSKNNPEIPVASQDEAYLESLGTDYSYIDSSIMYVAMREVSFNINGSTYKYVAYGNEIRLEEGEDLQTVTKKRLDSSTIHGILLVLLYVFTIAVIVCAWYLYCYSYVHFHGIDLILMADGYKCFLPFLGTLICVLVGSTFVGKTFNSILDSENSYLTTFIQRRVKQYTLKKFNL